MVKEWKRVTKVMAATWLMRGMDAQAMLAYFGDNFVEQVRSLPTDEKVGHLYTQEQIDNALKQSGLVPA